MIEGVQSQQTPISNKCVIDDDTRALKLAVELTMINLNKTQQSASTSPSMTTTKNHPQIHSQNIRLPTGQAYSLSPYHMTTKVFLQAQSHAVLTAPISLSSQQVTHDIDINDVSRSNSLTDISQSLANSIISEDRSKKSQNMTECVPVPSSEHVAEIVGRQGCKIKALRAKTNTYIKTPVRNEEPVFVVTGRKEDVSKAKHEILSAAEHFTVIRATRRLNDHVVANSAFSGGKNQLLGLYKNNLPPPSQTQGQVTIQVRVPYRLVGLVVGTKGNTIKHIQQETQTYIVTPSRDKEPIFEVTGLADNVDMARRHIEIHIATRIGNSQNNSMATSVSSPSPSPCATVRQSTDADSAESSLQSLNALNQMLNDDLHSEILTSIYKNGICSTLDCSQMGGNIINTDDKCNNLHSLNGFLGDIGVGMLSTEGKEKQESYSLNEHVNNQIKCVDFISNLMDTNVTQLGIEQRSKYT